MRILLEQNDLKSAMDGVLKELGTACKVSRAYFFERLQPPGRSGTDILISQRHEWVAEGVSAELDNPQLQNISLARFFPSWLPLLRAGEPVAGLVRDFPASERSLLDPQRILAIAVVPILVDGEFQGLVGFDDCWQERQWDGADLGILKAAAAGIGSTIQYERSTAALRHANEQLKQRAAQLQKGRRVALSLIEDAKLAEQKAESANEAKTRFLAFLSHEIRTPLHGILGYSELLLGEENMPPGAIEKIHSIQSASEIVLTLVDDLLELSRIETGRIDIDETREDVRKTTETALATHKNHAENAGLEFRLEIKPGVPDNLIMDHRRYGQILGNLVGNAVKFTAAGTVAIQINWLPRGGDSPAGRLQTSVRDTGRGIPEAEQQRIFDPFWRGEEPPLHGMSSTGLGLAISKNLCERLGGGITFESTPGSGSNFVLEIPARSAATRGEFKDPALTQATNRHMADSLPLEILIVDDVKTNRDLLATMLERLGYKARTAESGVKAIELFQHRNADLIFMDVLMPDLDGCETTRRIRALEKAAGKNSAIIVALSADAMSDNRARCMASGMDGFLTKPLRMENLITTLRKAAAPPPV